MTVVHIVALIEDGNFGAEASGEVPVKAVVAQVRPPALKPLDADVPLLVVEVEDRSNGAELGLPMQLIGQVTPEGLWVLPDSPWTAQPNP